MAQAQHISLIAPAQHISSIPYQRQWISRLWGVELVENVDEQQFRRFGSIAGLAYASQPLLD